MESGTHAVRLTSTVRPCVVRRRRQNMAASEMRIDRPLVRPSSSLIPLLMVLKRVFVTTSSAPG